MLLDYITEKRFLPIAVDVTVLSVCLSVCLSVTFMHCAKTSEDIDMVSFADNSPMSLPDCVKNLSYIG